MFMIPFGGFKCFPCSSCFVAPFLELEFGDCWEGHLVTVFNHESQPHESWGFQWGKKKHQLGQFMPIIPMSCHFFPSIPGWSWPKKCLNQPLTISFAVDMVLKRTDSKLQGQH